MTPKINTITIIGAGRMGLGIGQEIAVAGHDVIFHDIDPQILEQAKPKIKENLLRMAQWGIVESLEIQPALDRISTETRLDLAAENADLIIEAVVENLELKIKLFQALEQICRENTILASNTSTLMPTKLSEGLSRPDRILVAHYFYPAHLMPLVEIVRSELTSDQTVDRVYEFLSTMGKKPVICAKEAPGFIANRLQIALEREAFHMVQRGIATAQDVDKAVKYSFGRRMGVAGPFEILEHNEGYDMTVACEKYMLPDMDGSSEPYPLILEMVEKGKIGMRSGQGFYEWTPDFIEQWEKRMEKNLIRYLK